MYIYIYIYIHVYAICTACIAISHARVYARPRPARARTDADHVCHVYCLHFSICACHPCAGAMLIFSVPFQLGMIPEGNPTCCLLFVAVRQPARVLASLVGHNFVAVASPILYYNILYYTILYYTIIYYNIL